ncbi:hypothetical protein CMEL01_14137, partial [Colletotrichum melonis]
VDGSRFDLPCLHVADSQLALLPYTTDRSPSKLISGCSKDHPPYHVSSHSHTLLTATRPARCIPSPSSSLSPSLSHSYFVTKLAHHDRSGIRPGPGRPSWSMSGFLDDGPHSVPFIPPPFAGTLGLAQAVHLTHHTLHLRVPAPKETKSDNHTHLRAGRPE